MPATTLQSFVDLGAALVGQIKAGFSRGERQLDPGIALVLEDYVVAVPDIFSEAVGVVAQRQKGAVQGCANQIQHSAGKFLRAAAGLLATQLPHR